MAVCSEIHTKHINALCGQNVEFVNVKLAVYQVTTGAYMIKYFTLRQNIIRKYHTHTRTHAHFTFFHTDLVKQIYVAAVCRVVSCKVEAARVTAPPDEPR